VGLGLWLGLVVSIGLFTHEVVSSGKAEKIEHAHNYNSTAGQRHQKFFLNSWPTSVAIISNTPLSTCGLGH